MEYVRQYKSFINSHYLTEGIRMTAGILIPAFLLSYFDLLPLGIVMSFGALCVSITDIPGPVHHRKNGMIACTAIIFVTSILAGAVNSSEIFTGVLLAVFALLFSMFGVFGARPGSIGVSAMVVFILQIDNSVQPELALLQHALLLTAGALWYMSFSLLLHTFRPYKLAQQAMGEWMQTISSYLHTRAKLYEKNVNYPQVYRTLLQQQAVIQEKQTVLREILLKTRTIVKESTPTGRLLMITFIHMSEVFEKIITSYSRYSVLHKNFDETGLLQELHELINAVADELEDFGIALKGGKSTVLNNTLLAKLEKVKAGFEILQSERLEVQNLDTFISVKRTLQNLQDIIEQLQTMQQNVASGKPDKQSRQLYGKRDLNPFLTKQPITWSVLADNLNLKSDIFRHSLRVTIALVTGFIVAVSFDIGHGYWILLTIIVILKPAYSLSKKRNRDRLIGTIAGIAIGLGLIQLVDNNAALLTIMVVLMVANFTLMRTNYLVSVMLMTPYILIFFFILHPKDFTEFLSDRLIDTAIGSAIAFAASMLLFPNWEKYKIHPLLVASVEKIQAYFSYLNSGLQGDVKPTEQRLARKDALIALANISDAFNRMLNEPKYTQTNTENLQRFVVVLHSLVSYIATLKYFIKEDQPADVMHPLKQVAADIDEVLNNTIQILNGNEVKSTADDLPAIHVLESQSNNLLQQRLQELDLGMEETTTKRELYDTKSLAQQFKLISRSAIDLHKISADLKLEQ